MWRIVLIYLAPFGAVGLSIAGLYASVPGYSVSLRTLVMVTTILLVILGTRTGIVYVSNRLAAR